MKVVSEIGFDDLINSNYLDGDGAEFVGDIETLNRGDELMSILDREFEDYPEMTELVGYVESNIDKLAEKMGLIQMNNEFRDNLDNYIKQIEVAKKQSFGDEMFDLLEDLGGLADDMYYDISVVNFIDKDNVENFVTDSFAKIRDVRSLNTFENENYDALNQVLTNMEQDLEQMNQIL